MAPIRTGSRNCRRAPSREHPLAPVQPGRSATANLLTGLNIDEYLIRTDSSGAKSFLTDALGTAIALTDPSGTIQSQYAYAPSGKVTASGQANANSYQFTGRENDGTGLYFNRARYYSPTFQRFIAQDPIGFVGGGPNLYAYVENSPVSLKDPLGLFWIVVPIAPGGGLQIYYAAHFQDDPTNGVLPDSPGVYSLPGFSCPRFICELSDDQFNQYLNNENNELALLQTPMSGAGSNRTCGGSR